MELPPAALLFRSARQYVYGVLFSLAETQRKMERLAIRRRLPLEGKYDSCCSRSLYAGHRVRWGSLCEHTIHWTIKQALRRRMIFQIMH